MLCWQVLVSLLLSLPHPEPDMQDVAAPLTTCLAAAAAAAGPIHTALEAAAEGRAVSAVTRCRAVTAAVDVLSVTLDSLPVVDAEQFAAGPQLPGEVVEAAAAAAAVRLRDLLSSAAAADDGAGTAVRAAGGGGEAADGEDGDGVRNTAKKRKQAKRAHELGQLLEAPGLPLSGAPLYWDEELRGALGLPLIGEQQQDDADSRSALHAEVGGVRRGGLHAEVGFVLVRGGLWGCR